MLQGETSMVKSLDDEEPRIVQAAHKSIASEKWKKDDGREMEHQIDIKIIFLNYEWEEKNYMQQPKG